MFSSTEIECPPTLLQMSDLYISKFNKTVDFKVEYVLKGLRELKSTIQSLFLTDYPSSAEDQRHE